MNKAHQIDELNKENPCIDDYHIQEVDDIRRVQRAILELRDRLFTLDQCGDIWQTYSWSVQASWLDIPDNIENIISHIESMYDFKGYDEMLIDY